MRTRSKPHGFSPKATQIVRGINQHAELTAKFAQQALLYTVHKVATILIISEDLGGHPATGPPSLWIMTEFQTPWRWLHLPARERRTRARDGSLVEPLINFSLLHTASNLIYRGPLPDSCLCTTQHNIKDSTKTWQAPSTIRLQTRQLVLAEVLQ